MSTKTNKTIQFTVTIEEFAKIDFNAKARGLTPSQFAKQSTFEKVSKCPAKGEMAKLYINEEQTP